MSLTTLPPIRRSPLVCFSSPQMTRRNVVLPQPDGPSSTMNWPSGTVRLMPLTAETSPNFLTMSLVNTAAIAPSRIASLTCDTPSASAPAERRRCRPFHRLPPCRMPGPRARARSERRRSGLARPLLEDDLASLRGPFHRVFGTQLTCRRLRHHVGNDEGVVDLVGGGPSRPRIAGDGGPLVRILQDRQLVVRGRGRIVG